MSLAQLKQLELHDAEVCSLHLDYIAGELAVVVSQYVEEAQNHRPVEVKFQQLSYLETSPWLLNKAPDEVEWISLAVQPTGETYAAELCLLIRHGPSIKLSFTSGRYW